MRCQWPNRHKSTNGDAFTSCALVRNTSHELRSRRQPSHAFIQIFQVVYNRIGSRIFIWRSRVARAALYTFFRINLAHGRIGRRSFTAQKRRPGMTHDDGRQICVTQLTALWIQHYEHARCMRASRYWTSPGIISQANNFIVTSRVRRHIRSRLSKSTLASSSELAAIRNIVKRALLQAYYIASASPQPQMSDFR